MRLDSIRNLSWRIGDMRRLPIYKVWRNCIEQFCINHGLDFEKLRTMGICYNQDVAFFQRIDHERGRNGLLDETPADVVLIMQIVDGKPVFKETEITRKYLSCSHN